MYSVLGTDEGELTMGENSTCIFAIDIGTSSVKVSVLNESGVVEASASRPYETRQPRPGYAQQTPDDWWKAAISCSKEIREKSPGLYARVAVIGVCGHMLGVTPVDADGNALADHMIHSDSRAKAQFAEIDRKIGIGKMYEITGNILDARSCLSKFLWLKQERPEIYRKTAKILQSKDYVTSKLTGNIDSTDGSDASHAQLINIHTQKYEPEIYRELGLDMDKLPQVHAGTDIVGKLTEKAAALLGLTPGLPVIAGGGDGACSDLGGGNVRIGDICCSLGTTGYFSSIVGDAFIDPKRRVFNLLGMDGKTSSLYGTVQSAGSSLNWVMRLLGVSDILELNRMAAQVPKGSEGLIFVPYLDGERSPIYDTESRGMFFGMSSVHRPEHFARAVFEGVAFALNQCLEGFRDNMKVERIRVIGGGSRSDLWRQIMADVWDCEVAVMSGAGTDSNGLGIAAAAGVAIGLYKDFAEGVGELTLSDLKCPEGDNSAYRYNYDVYKVLYEKTAQQMHELARISG